MSDAVAKYIEKIKGVQNELLRNFSARDEAIAYLVQETGLSEKECSDAYDLYIKIDVSKNMR